MLAYLVIEIKEFRKSKLIRVAGCVPTVPEAIEERI